MDRSKKIQPLTEKIEREYKPAADDVLEPDLLQFLNDFIERFNQTAPLGPIDLTTPEAARSSADILSDRQAQIDALLKNVQALKQIVRNN